MTSALIEHLKGKSDAVIAYTTSVLGFVPLAAYSATSQMAGQRQQACPVAACEEDGVTDAA
jgi:hypothetical protein